jgi:PAS domain S-box-containing protein
VTLLTITGLYLVIFIWVTAGYLRRRDPLLRDVMLIFAVIAVLFMLGVLRLIIGAPPRMVAGLSSTVLLAQPILTWRLIGHLRRIPVWVLPASVLGWLITAAPVLLLPRPLPPAARWPAVGWFFVADLAAGWLLGLEARHRGGAARVRLWCAAIGTALFGLALLLAGSGTAVAVLARVAAVAAGLMYMLAFVPPRWLRRTWSSGVAYALMRRLLAAQVHDLPTQTWRRYRDGARELLGADDVAVLLNDNPNMLQPVTHSGHPLSEHRFNDEGVAELLTYEGTVDTHANTKGRPTLAVELAESTGTRFVTATPLQVFDQRGALVLLSRYRTLFAEDDLALIAELAGQAAALAERAAVLAERQRLAVIVESSHDAIIGKNLDGTITSWNTGAEQLYGFAATEAVGQHAGMLFADRHPDLEDRLMARVADGERIDEYQVQRRRKDRTIITVALTLSPITDPTGHTIGVASISRDVGERQRAEAMFKGLLEAAPDAIVGVTRDGSITLINAQAERLFGYQREELLGQPVEILVPERLRNHHPQKRDSYFADPLPRPMGAGAALAAIRKNGTEFPAEISLSALETDRGVIVSAAIRDVSERLEAQAERERLAAQTERDAAERRLQHTRRLESLGQLAGGVAHDFNNILAVIANYSELLIESLDTDALTADDLAAARADLVQISRAAERATRLTKQLLAFGRRDITQAQVLSLNHVIGDVEQMLRRTLGEHIHLITQLEHHLWPVNVDPGQMEQILVNLAVNARDAMPSGGTLSIDTSNIHLEQSDVEDTTLTPGRYVRMRLSDTGAGMPAEVLERAFEPFFTTKPQGAGTGLGLATVYGIAAATGGHVRLYSEPGIGTTVTILLPAVDAQIPADAPDPVQQPPAGVVPHETILLVEDEAALRDTTTRILRRVGYQVLVACGGGEAIEIARTHSSPIDLLLTDVIMPKMMGNEVAARFTQIRPDVPVVYMSGYAQPILTEKGTLPPGVTIVEKPFTGQELLDRINSCLHRTGTAETKNHTKR